MQSVESTDGVTVALHNLGGNGPPLLLAHATGFAGRMWGPVVRHLPGFQSFAPDVRGHGDAETPLEDPDLSWAGVGRDLLAVVDALGLSEVVAAGHSMGAAGLLLAEQQRPGTFSRLYCYEPVMSPPERRMAKDRPDNVLATAALKRRAQFASRIEARENFAAKPPLDTLAPDALDAYIEHCFRPATGQGSDAADSAAAVELKCRPEHESRLYIEGGDHDGFDRLGDVGCPVTIAHGEIIASWPSSFAAAMADALPNGRLVPHLDLGHFGPVQAPETIAADIRDALTS